MRILHASIPVILVAMVAGCAKNEPAPTPSLPKVNLPLTIFADNYPMQYFTERIAGDLARVTLPVKPGRDPAYWRPNDEDVARLQAADLVVINGAGYAKWYDTISLPNEKLVDTSRGFQDRFITIKDAVVHSHGPEGEHSHEGLAPNTWLDPDLAILQARAVAKALRVKVPDRVETIDANLASLEADLKSFGERLKTLTAKRHEPLLASHPVYDYLARFCGWDLQSVHWEPDEMPAEEGWKELEALLTKHPARWMIWEGQPIETNSQRLHGMGINSVVFDCLPNRPATGDYLSVMNDNLKQLEKIYDYEPDGDNAPSK